MCGEPASGVSPSDTPLAGLADGVDTAMHDVAISNSEDTSKHEDDMPSEWFDRPVIPLYDPDGPVQTSEHMGDLINRAYVFETDYEDKYEDDEARDIFDDGLDGDESFDYGSEVSATNEELEEPENVMQVIKLEATSEGNTAFGLEPEGDASNAWHSEYEAGASLLGVAAEVHGDNVKQEDGSDETRNIIIPEMMETALLPSKSFAELQDLKYELLYRKQEAASGGKSYRSLAQDADGIRCNILGLEEAQIRIVQELQDIEQKLEGMHVALQTAEAKKQSADDTLASHFEAAGISRELYDAYEAFCQSLDPAFGQRGGFDITCSGDHKGSYIRYDPELALFKQFVEMPYSKCNFRSEASVEETGWAKERVHVVQFWPLKAPEPLHGTAATWGEQYPDLYTLATSAARSGSHAALKMLLALPDMHASFAGGWLFDYQFEPKLCGEPVAGKRWRFRSAHEIDHPVGDEEKKKNMSLELLLGSVGRR